MPAPGPARPHHLERVQPSHCSPQPSRAALAGRPRSYRGICRTMRCTRQCPPRAAAPRRAVTVATAYAMHAGAS
eukprot:1586360-Prymnesium_polylepis.1